MKQITSNVYIFEGLLGSNVYLLITGKELALVDSGLSIDAGKIIAQLQEANFSLSNLKTIVLTHAHGDHIGGTAKLTRRSNARVWAYQREVPYIEQTKYLSHPLVIQRILFWITNHVLFRQLPIKVDRALSNRENILYGLQVIHTPGHTPGSISLYQAKEKILFCGDALFNINPITGKRGLQVSLPIVTANKKEAWESVRKISSLPVEVLLFGHGKPILKGAREQVKALLEKGNC
ncbi:MAG: MBL fold metallo-hydrolase [Caldisericaceae bacterium]|nr:MBL fold metallo-hydrolase [Caldisericaceae bacterium]